MPAELHQKSYKRSETENLVKQHIMLTFELAKLQKKKHDRSHAGLCITRSCSLTVLKSIGHLRIHLFLPDGQRVLEHESASLSGSALWRGPMSSRVGQSPDQTEELHGPNQRAAVRAALSCRSAQGLSSVRNASSASRGCMPSAPEYLAKLQGEECFCMLLNALPSTASKHLDM